MTTLVITHPDPGIFEQRRVQWDVLNAFRDCTDREYSTVDLRQCPHLKPYSIALIAAISLASPARIRLLPPGDDECRDHLGRLGLYNYFDVDGFDSDRTARDTNVPIRHLTTTSGNDGHFATEAVETWLSECGGAPVGVAPELENHLDETINNALGHAASSIGCLVAGQAFPTTQWVDVAILDRGLGILRHLSGNPAYAGLTTDEEAIEMATVDAVTGTPPGETDACGNPNSGAGLAALRGYCELGAGLMTILSGHSFVTFGPLSPIKHDFNGGFPGTLVNIRFRLDP